MLECTVEAPTRIDLAGGTLDLWPIHRMLEHKATVNVALSLFARTTVRVREAGAEYCLGSVDQNLELVGDFATVTAAEPLPLHRLMVGALWVPELGPLTVHTQCQSPQGAGLGGSSSLAITLAHALGLIKQQRVGGAVVEGAALVAQAQDIEATCLCTPTGIQDYWAAVNGGVTLISYPPGAPTVTKYPLQIMPELANEVVVCFSGRSRLSGINNWQIYKDVMEKSPRIIGLLSKIGEQSVAASEAVVGGQWQKLLHHAHEEWLLRTQLCEGIETEETRRINAAACRAGAYFTRICGAGGGGVMAIFVPKERRPEVQRAVVGAGGELLDACFTDRGVSRVASA